MDYMLNTLPEIIAQVVHFSRDDYQNGEYPDDCAWNTGYIVACLLAQHTVEGGSGVETEQGYAGMKVTEDMPYDERVRLAKQLVDYWGGAKSHPAADSTGKPPRLCIRVEGGVIQSVFSDAPVDVLVIDYDTDGVPQEELFPMPQDGSGRTESCCLSAFPAHVMPEEIERIDKAVADDTAHSVTATAVGWITGTRETTR